jgi:hypothetical protein
LNFNADVKAAQIRRITANCTHELINQGTAKMIIDWQRL